MLTTPGQILVNEALPPEFRDHTRTLGQDEIDSLLSRNGIVVDYDTIEMAKLYFDMRADLLNNVVKHNLMNACEAKEAFEELLPIHRDNDFKCKLPMNKQKGERTSRSPFCLFIFP